MNKRFSLLALVAAAVVAAAPLQAQDLKVGYTDYEVLLANMPQMANVQQQLQAFYTENQTKLQQQAQDFQDKAQRYERQASLLSAEARAEREQELGTLQQQVQTAAQTAEQMLQQKRVELMRPLFERLQEAIDSVAKSKSLDIVLPTQVGGDPFILYVNETRITDITRDVATALGIPVDDTTADGN